MRLIPTTQEGENRIPYYRKVCRIGIAFVHIANLSSLQDLQKCKVGSFFPS